MAFTKLKLFIQKHIPTQQSMEKNKFLHIFGKVMLHPYLWTFNKYSIARAVGAGLFSGYMVFPAPSLIAIGIAIIIRANLPLAAILVIYANPLTDIPLFYFAYHIGCLLLKIPEQAFDIHLTWHWLTHEFLTIWKPLLFGSFICGLVLGIAGYLSVWAVYWLTPWHKKVEQAEKLQKMTQSKN